MSLTTLGKFNTMPIQRYTEDGAYYVAEDTRVFWGPDGKGNPHHFIRSHVLVTDSVLDAQVFDGKLVRLRQPEFLNILKLPVGFSKKLETSRIEKVIYVDVEHALTQPI